MFTKLRQCLTPVVTLVAIASIVGLGLPARGQFIPPSDMRRVANRQGAGTRGDCWHETQPSLTALTPVSNIGLTTSSHPTVYWYMPRNSYPEAEFTLFEVGPSPMEQVPVYKSSAHNTGETGIGMFNLSQDDRIPPLKIGKDYRWLLKLVCDPGDPSAILFVEGWIHRVEPDSDLMTLLNMAAPVDRYRIYAESGLWYDALNELATLRQANPQDQTLSQKWTTLFESEAVELREIAQQTQPNHSLGVTSALFQP